MKQVEQTAPLLLPTPDAKTISTAAYGTKKGRSPKPLPKKLRHGGFDYRQIAREGDYAIYEQRWGNSPNVCYEVVRIRRHDGFTIKGKYIEPAEYYPSNEAWGVDGWTVLTLDAAYAKLKEVRR